MSVTRWFYVIYWTTLVSVALLVTLAVGLLLGVVFADVAKADTPARSVMHVTVPNEMEFRALGTLAPGGHGLLPGYLRTRPAAKVQLHTFHFHYQLRRGK